MKVTKTNFTSALPLIESCISECKFLSFDLEMTGINFDLKTEANRLDSYQFRYKKICEIVKNYEVVEVGLTFYCEAKKENNEKPEETDEYYSERTFTFTVLRNSKLKNIVDFYTVENPENIFTSFSTYNPDTHRFLHSSNFDYDNLYKEGINYAKLALKDKIQESIRKHLQNGKPANSINVLSKTNEKILIQTISELVKFLMNKLESNDTNDQNNIDKQANQNKNSNNNKKKNKNQNTQNQKQHKISGLPLSVINYILSLNLRKITKLSNFNVSRDKADKSAIVVEKSKSSIKLDDFLNEYISLENFLEILNIEFIKKQKFSLVVNSISKDRSEDIVNDEIGFSHVIKLIIDKKPKIVGHNVLFDLHFIYEKFCDSFPENFLDYCKNINYLFPNIYDTKYLIDRFFKEKDFDHTNLVYIYEKLGEEGYTDYVRFVPEVSDDFFIGGFAPQKVEAGKDELAKFHSAGFDSLITGRCFVNIMKALENNYLNKKILAKALAAKGKALGEAKNENNNKAPKDKGKVVNNNNDSIKNENKKNKKDKNKYAQVINNDCNLSNNLNSNSMNVENPDAIKTNGNSAFLANNSTANDDIRPMEIEEEAGKLAQNDQISIEKPIEIEKDLLERIADEPSVLKEEVLVQTLGKIEHNASKDEIKLKTGWVNFDADLPHLDSDETNSYMQHIIKSNPMKRDKLANKIILRNYEYPFNIIDFEDIEGTKIKENFLLKEVLKHVFIIVFKDRFVSVFDICSIIQNDFFNYTSIKIDDNKAFFEIAFDEEEENQKSQILNDVFAMLKNNNKISEVCTYEEFHNNNFLNLFR